MPELTVEDLSVGSGPIAKLGSRVTLRYVGTLEDGTALPSGPPLSFELGDGEVIEGWEQGIPGMRAGGRRRLRVPPELGYQDRGAPSVPPNAWLIFEIELLSVG
jgi:FKBP-type peptidyl-prolyl cis-trans isomerase